MKLNYKNILIIILMIISILITINDLIALTIGASYTLIGWITCLINITIIGKGLDYFTSNY